MFQTIHLRKLLSSLALTIGTGFLANLLSGGQREIYQTLEKPPFSPPGAVFGIVWAVLYVLMGLALYLVRSKGNSADTKGAESIFYLQLLVNFFWPIFFFTFGLLCFSAVWLGLLLLFVTLTLRQFYKISKPAFWLMVPYFLWCIYALYLNMGVCFLN